MMADSKLWSEEKNNLIIQKAPELLKTISPTEMFWATLASREVIQVEKIREIQRDGNASPHAQITELLDHVRRAPNTRYAGFLRALAESEHEHVVTDVLKEQMPETSKSAIRTHPNMPPSTDATALGIARDILRNAMDEDTTATGIEEKKNHLKISVVNIDPNHYLLMDKDFFNYGRFWKEHPCEKIQPNTAVTFLVCNCNYSCMGISGGVGFGVYDMHGKRAQQGMFVCSFSNPLAGIIRGKCAIAETIQMVWDDMSTCGIIREKSFGFHKSSATSLTFIWKSNVTPW